MRGTFSVSRFDDTEKGREGVYWRINRVLSAKGRVTPDTKPYQRAGVTDLAHIIRVWIFLAMKDRRQIKVCGHDGLGEEASRVVCNR